MTLDQAATQQWEDCIELLESFMGQTESEFSTVLSSFKGATEENNRVS